MSNEAVAPFDRQPDIHHLLVIVVVIVKFFFKLKYYVHILIPIRTVNGISIIILICNQFNI